MSDRAMLFWRNFQAIAACLSMPGRPTGLSMQEIDLLPLISNETGISSLNYAVLTHPHADHYGGIRRVAQHVHIDTIVVPLLHSYPIQFRLLIDSLKSMGISIRMVSSGDQLYIGNDERIYVLNPSIHNIREQNLNDCSIVMKIYFGNTSFLFTGDAGEEIEHMLERKYSALLQSDVLKIGHHGSDMSTGPEFLKEVHPSMALISVGRKNMFGHPSGIVLKVFEEKWDRGIPDRYGSCEYYRKRRQDL